MSLVLYDFLSDLLNGSATVSHRVQVVIVAFIPPLEFSMFHLHGFITELGYAAFSMVVLTIFLPVAMVVSQRKHQEYGGDRVKGGNAGLIIVTFAGILIMLVLLLQIADLLPAVG